MVDPPILQAPMAGFTNYVFRQIVRSFGGAGLLATEMISARGFVGIEESNKGLPDRLWGVSEEPRPLAVQIWDNDPEVMARVGAKLAHELKVSVVDINFGCPVRQVTQAAHSGSYLLKHPDQVGAIIERVVAACAPTPVTAKIRLGTSLNQISANEIAQVVEQSGAKALTVHGRTACQYFKGQADWERISEIKSYLKEIPLIGNGDLDSAHQAVDLFRKYNIDGIMIARAALGRPWIYAQFAAALRNEPIPPDPSLDEERKLLLKHFDLVIERFGVEQGCTLMRKFACCYAQGKPNVRKFRTNVSRVSSVAEFYQIVEDYFPRPFSESKAS